MSDKLDTRVIQITNVAPGATREQMKTLFGYIGHIDELKLYPPEESEVQVPARVCYVKYDDTTSVGVALHLTNTVFIDRALIVVPVMDGKIPDEQTALQMAPSAIAGMMPGQPTWPSNVMSQLQGTGTNQVITTNDPRLTAHGLPQYPPLPGSTDPAKIEEIRRTVVVGNLDAITTGEHVLSFFSQVGEIKYVKLSEDSDGTRIALVEFSDQRSIASALTYSGVMFQNRPLRVTHSYSSIIKPQNKHQQAAQREIEEAMKKVKEAQSLITAAADMGDINIDKTVSKLANDLHSSRSRSRSKSKKRRSRSHSRHRSRSKSHKSHKSHKSRSRSRQRSKSRRSRSKKRSRSRSKKQRSRSRSKSRSRRNRSRSRSRRRSSLPRRSRSLSRRQRSKSRSRRRSRSSKQSSRKSRSRSRKRSRSKSKRSGSQEKIKISDSVDKKSISKSLSPPKLEREDSLYEESSSRRSSEDTKTDELSSVKKSSPPVPVVKSSPPVPEVKSSPPVPDVKRSSSKARSRSRSRRISSRRSRSKSGSRQRSRKGSRRSRSRSRKRSRSRRRSRSRSGSRHRSRKDKKRDTERSRGHSRDKDKDKSKRKHKEKEKEKDDKKDSKVTRNYDEEEQTIYDDSAQASSASGRSTSDRNQMESRNGGGTSAVLDTTGDDSNLQQIDMDMSD
ncbi:hypothetical protein ACJMK2_040598 [Sinanodonta woodiana]|uniref:RRM domain-containing protein n=1 Tax=Sinanodonta woodiana TaxID=1069815 RepID=A0ABD3W239_SINWO